MHLREVFLSNQGVNLGTSGNGRADISYILCNKILYEAMFAFFKHEWQNCKNAYAFHVPVMNLTNSNT